jgi:hypothetical protein
MRATIPTQSLRSNTSSTGTVSRRRDDEIEVHTTVPTTRPTDIADFTPTVDFGDPMVAIGEGVGFMEVLAFIPRDHHLFRPLRHLREACHQI